MTNETRPLRVFLCHASEDKAKVREIYQRLQADGIEVWLDEEKLLPGQKWRHEIPKAVRNSDVILVCLSKRSTTKEGYVQKEISYALDIAEEKLENTIFIIPLRLEECELPGRLRRFQAANYFIKDTYQRLLKSFQIRAKDVKAELSPQKTRTSKSVEEELEAKTVEARTILPSTENVSALTSKTPTGIPIYTFARIPFVKVAAGEFLMGSSDDDHRAKEWEKPQHIVDIPYDYWISRFPVTHRNFIQFLLATDYSPETNYSAQKVNYPINAVTWTDALSFIKWLNRTFRKNLPDNYLFSLPNEPEWEKAARGTDGRFFPWGNDFGLPALGLELCNTKEADYRDITPVGYFSPQSDSPYGVADMAGNISEITRSIGGRGTKLQYKYPYDNKEMRENLIANAIRVTRGGSFSQLSEDARCACRNYNSDFGLRLVITPIKATH